MPERRPETEGGDRSVLHFHKDETGIIRDVDEATTRVLGWHPEDLVGRRSLEFIHPRDHDRVLASWVRLLATPGGEQRLRIRHSDSSGRWVWFEMINHNFLGHPTSPIVVTELVVLGEVSEEDGDWYTTHLLHRLTETLPVGILEIDRNRRTIFMNARLAKVLGRPLARSAHEMFDGVVSEDSETMDKALDAVLGGQDVDIEVGLTHPDLGERRCGVLLRALTDRSGRQVTGAVLCVTDVTDEARAREEMKRRAAHDGLTGCLNRDSILDALTTALSDRVAGVDGRGVAAVYVDLDRFKAVNDQLGHAAGDILLRTIAERLQATARVSDFVGRIGGDEFLLVFPGTESAAAAEDLGERIAITIGRPMSLNGMEVTPSASVGVAWSADGAVDAAAFIAAADEAMYQSKRKTAGPPEGLL
ncbi:MAG TPA: GGDEF domain-containing protein [Rugosimonospora sp.]|nr:GGDEF domain-containing protein [Rugosimonospora sp.]